MMLLGFNILDLCTTFVLVSISILILISVVLKLTTKPHPCVFRSEKEHYFKSGSQLEKKERFPSLQEKWSVHLSVIVPAYNEEKRLPPMLEECLNFLENRKKNFRDFTYEVIIVNDGSQDKTSEIALGYTKKYGSNVVRLLDLEKNRGKGGAVRLGMFSARGALLLFADADGATKFADLEKLEKSVNLTLSADSLLRPEIVSTRDAIVCGSRAHLEQEAVASRSFFRTILMYGFHMLVWVFTVRGIRDTQCGFKLLTRSAAQSCFKNLHIEKWAFDVELLLIAQNLQIPVSEVAVNWTEIEGSKVVPVWSWLQMGRDIFLIWLRYQIGAWKMHKEKSK